MTLARPGDLDPPVVGVGRSRELERELRIGWGEAVNRNCLAIARTGTPDDTDADPGAGRARKHDPSGVGLPLAQRKSALLDASRRATRHLHQRRVLADVWIVPIHHHGFIRTDRTPHVLRPVAP